jgi:hypothetical protein
VQTTPAGTEATVETPVTSKRRRKAPADPKEKKPSALDAAARVLAEAGRAMNCQEMIAAMAARNYWSSPGGQTPAAKLFSEVNSVLDQNGLCKRPGCGSRRMATGLPICYHQPVEHTDV